MKHYIAVCLYNMNTEITTIEGETHYFQGQAYSLRVVAHEGRSKVLLHQTQLYLYARAKSDALAYEKILSRWYAQQLLLVVPPLFEKWQHIIGVKMQDWTIKKMKTCWGTCNTQTKRICLNLELIKKPLICLEYIMVHELVHLLERGHNRRFYGFMDQFMPNWREVKKILDAS